MLIAGMVLMDESKFYTWKDLFILFSAGLIIVSGIYVLTIKQSKVLLVNSANTINYDDNLQKEDFHEYMVR